MKKLIILILPAIMFCTRVQSEPGDTLKFIVSIPAADYPASFHGNYFYPSMWQSLETSKSFYQFTSWGLESVLDKYIQFNSRFLTALTHSAVEVAYHLTATYLPGGDSWLHEEFHRAVMNKNDIYSFNDVYYFRLFSDMISVSHVKDDDLVKLKTNEPRDMVRLHLAGYEAQNELVLALQKDQLFYSMKTPMYVVYWLNILNNIGYIRLCSDTEADILTDESNVEDGADIEVRDFTGLDFTAWTYDLFRPNEPYLARGIHPSGVGIDRYIRFSDLNEEEQDYIYNQGLWSFISLADPSLLGINTFPIKHYADGSQLLFNANLKHYLAPFGSSVNINIFLKKNNFNFFMTYLNQSNYDRYFPGIDMQVVSYPVFNHKLFLSPRLAVWLQPEDLAFKTENASAGMLASASADIPFLKYFYFSLQAEAKTAGWVAGNEYLDPLFSGRFGLKIKY